MTQATQINLTGQISSASFEDWICHRAKLLDLKGWVMREGDRAITIVVSGPQPMIDAMEMACSLGPINVQVDRIESTQRALKVPPESFTQRASYDPRTA